MMKRLLVLVLALGLSGCAANQTPDVNAPQPTFVQKALDKLPKNADGTLNVSQLVNWAGDGIMVVCYADPQSAVCTVGMNAVQVLATKGQDPRVVLAAVLDLEDRFPVSRAYLRWLSDTLVNWIAAGHS